MRYHLEVTRRPIRPELTRSESRSWQLHRQLSRRLDRSTLEEWRPTIRRNLRRLRRGHRNVDVLPARHRAGPLRDVDGLIEQVLGREIDLIDYGGLKPMLDDDIRRKAATELLHIKGWLEGVDEIIELGKEDYLADELLQEAGDSPAHASSAMRSIPMSLVFLPFLGSGFVPVDSMPTGCGGLPSTSRSRRSSRHCGHTADRAPLPTARTDPHPAPAQAGYLVRRSSGDDRRRPAGLRSRRAWSRVVHLAGASRRGRIS